MGKVNFCKGIKVANKVLKFLRPLVKNESFDITIESYCNCREQGYQFVFYPNNYSSSTTFSVAENRNSDSIVIYQTKFPNAQGLNSLSEKAYKKNDGIKYFRYDEHEKAAQYIIDMAISTFTAQALTKSG